MTKQELGRIRMAIDVALVAVAEDMGLGSLTTGACKYTESTFTFSVEGVKAGGVSRSAEAYVRHRITLNLPMLGTTFEYGRRTYKTVGLSPTGVKVSVERDDGKPFWFKVRDLPGIIARQKGT